MFGSTLFGLDTAAWLAEQRRATTALIERAARPAAVAARAERQPSAQVACAELACC